MMNNRSRFLVILFSVIVIALTFIPVNTINRASAQATAPWTVEYYNTTNLAGAVAYSAEVNTVGFDWMLGAPAPGVNPNFFSARWTSIQDLNRGIYQIQVEADDGVRVFVDNAPLINEFHTSTNETYTETFDLPDGQHVIRVEYYEGSGVAFLDFELDRINSNPDQPIAVVQAGRLNVRNDPSVITGDVLTQVTQNEALVAIGRTADSAWWQIVANGIIGWVSGQWVNVLNANVVPVTEAETPAATGYTLTTTGNLNIRSGPGVTNAIVGWLPYQQTVEIIGRNADNSWWQIQYGDVTGWISAFYATLQFGIDINDIPVTAGIEPATRELTANANLNIRSGPAVSYAVVGWLPYTQDAVIIGRNADNTWWQIRYGDVIGWVSGFYVTLEFGIDITNIPITG